MDELKFTSVADSSQMEHAKKSQELQSGVSPGLPFLYQAAVSWAQEPLGTTAGAAQAQSRNQRTVPLNRLDPAFCRLPGWLWELESRPPCLAHYASLLVVGGRWRPMLFFSAFNIAQFLLSSSFFLLLLFLMRDSIILQPVEDCLGGGEHLLVGCVYFMPT